MSEHNPIHQTQFEIDGRLIHSLEDFFRVIGEAVSGTGGYFGENLDALDSCLFGGYRAEPPCEFIWMHHDESRESLGYQETIKQLEIRLTKCHPSNRVNVATDLDCARRGVGKTAFDWIVGIFQDAEEVTLVLC